MIICRSKSRYSEKSTAPMAESASTAALERRRVPTRIATRKAHDESSSAPAWRVKSRLEKAAIPSAPRETAAVTAAAVTTLCAEYMAEVAATMYPKARVKRASVKRL